MKLVSSDLKCEKNFKNVLLFIYVKCKKRLIKRSPESNFKLLL